MRIGVVAVVASLGLAGCLRKGYVDCGDGRVCPADKICTSTGCASLSLPIDAQYFDAPADAPFACPPIGTAPKFSQYFHQTVTRGCSHYTASTPATNLALALCPSSLGGPSTQPQLEEGKIDSPTLMPSTLLPDASVMFGIGKLAPDGDELWVNRTGTISVYRRSGNTWTYDFDVFQLPTIDARATVSTPMRGASGRTVLYITGVIHELVENPPGTWSDARTYTADDLGVLSLHDPLNVTPDSVNLSPDGLRIVFTATTNTFDQHLATNYADRASVTDRFSKAVLLEGPPAAAMTPFMTEDCSRLYFSGLGSVLYIPQQ